MPCALILVFQYNLAPLTIIRTGDGLFYCDNNRIVINLMCNIPYIGLISMKKFSNKYTKFMFQRIYFRTPDLNCRVLLLHINFGGIYFRRETAKQNIRKQIPFENNLLYGNSDRQHMYKIFYIAHGL